MRSVRQVLPLAVIGLSALLGPAGMRASSAGASASPSRRYHRPRAAPSPEVLLTGATRETRAVEARLAAFVRAVRRHDGARAVRFLSRETLPPVRAAVARRDWPWRTAPQDLGPLFALPGLRLRTLALRRGQARVRIGPQHSNPYSLEAVGFYDLGMVREGVRWQVTLPAIASPRAGSGRGR